MVIAQYFIHNLEHLHILRLIIVAIQVCVMES